jgi:hypothetical protein
MPLERRKVFEPSVFYTLSGLVHQSGDDEDESDIEKLQLQPDELAKLQGFYDELVCKDKVAKEYAKVAAGKGGPTLPDFNRKSLKCIERIHSDVGGQRIFELLHILTDQSLPILRLKTKPITCSSLTTFWLVALMRPLSLPLVHLDGLGSLHLTMKWLHMSIRRATLPGFLRHMRKAFWWPR